MESHGIINASIGLMFVILGFIIMKYKAVYLMAGYKPGRYDDDKMSKICGSHLLFSGLMLILYSTLFFLVPEQMTMHYIVMYSVFTIALIRMVYQCEKYARK